MEKIAYNKLVRDRISEIMEGLGKQYEIQTLSEADFAVALLRKVGEEAAEVQTAQGRDELVKELADLAEVIKTLCEIRFIDPAEIESVRVKRRQERGGFGKRLLLVWGEKD
ncbi:MAG: nucleoside triphosphate pyrophosphohydrolase [Patescibacteria group bacterium]